jgi:hypothetical protein
MSEGKAEDYESTPTSSDSSRGRKGLTIGRVVNLTTLVVHVATFVTALCVIGVVGNFLVQLNYFGSDNTLSEGHCPIYTVYKAEDDAVRLAPDGVCVWFIAGHVILAASAVAFFVVGIIRVIFAMDIGIIGTLVEVAGTVFLILLAFSVAVSFSVGIAITCDQISKSSGTQDVQCQLSGFPSGVNHCFTNGTRTTQFCWYNDAQAAQVRFRF